ncbi:MAG: Rieske 2Fe-2S domain-containing protein [Candidatus Tyrphobacter sp.]
MNERERIVAIFLVAAMLASGGFIAAYVTGGNRLLEGSSLTAVAIFFCAAALGFAFWILPPEQIENEIDEYPSSDAERATQTMELVDVERKVVRSKALMRILYVALGTFGLALVVPIRSFGPNPYKTLFHTKWRKGDALVRVDGTVVRADELTVKDVETVFPQHAVGDPMSQATLIRLPIGLVADAPQGCIVYSRLCTHAGCPVALYRAAVQELACPCHQSVFNVLRNGAVVSGPADHALPRLAIAIDAAGVLRADGDFPVPVGPGFWERP